MVEINRETISSLAQERAEENDAFRAYLKQADGVALDKMVHDLNNSITPLIDCTVCAACCRGLMINVAAP